MRRHGRARQMIPLLKRTKGYLEKIWDHSQSPYKMLDLSPSSSLEEIKKRFYEKSKLVHPDIISKNGETGDSEAFRKIVEAYSVLIDENKRSQIDSVYLNQEPCPGEAFDNVNRRVQEVSRDQYLSQISKKNRADFEEYYNLRYKEKEWTTKNLVSSLNFYIGMWDKKKETDKQAESKYQVFNKFTKISYLTNEEANESYMKTLRRPDFVLSISGFLGMITLFYSLGEQF